MTIPRFEHFFNGDSAFGHRDLCVSTVRSTRPPDSRGEVADSIVLLARLPASRRYDASSRRNFSANSL